jgi:hypothetical protein
LERIQREDRKTGRRRKTNRRHRNYRTKRGQDKMKEKYNKITGISKKTKEKEKYKR